MHRKSLSATGNVLSVDIAHAKYADNGIAFLENDGPKVISVHPSELGLKGKPQVTEFAQALEAFCSNNGVTVLMLDGPQGWRYPHSQIQHMRLCERVLNTPGKTGNVGQVKPRTYLGYIQFSVDLFDELRLQHGWNLLTQDWHIQPTRRWLVESFPTAAWKTLGLTPLPAKSKASHEDIHAWRDQLTRITGWLLQDQLSHDQLQAAVALPAGQMISQGKSSRVLLVGVDPSFDDEGNTLEGLIALPTFDSSQTLNA